MPYPATPMHEFTFDRGFNAGDRRLSDDLIGATAEGSANALWLGEGYWRGFRGFASQGVGTGSRIMKPIGKTWGGIKDIAISNKTFTDGNVTPGTDTITISSHGFFVGMSFTLTTTGTLPAGLALATTYYAIIVDSNNIKPASSLANALAGTPVDITAAAGGGTHTVNVTASSAQAAGSVLEDIGRSLWGIGAGQVHVQGANVSGFTLSTLLKLVLLSSGSYGSPVMAGLAQPSAPDVGVTASTGDANGPVSFKIERRRPSTGGRSLASPTSLVVVPRGKKVRITFPLAATGQTHWRLFVTLMGFGGEGIHYGVPYNGALDIAESTVAAGTVEGIARSIELNWQDGDLVPEEASFDDYPPPAATHCLRLENVMALVGAYADSVSSPTSTNTGVAIAVSKPNNYESYVPTHLLFLPEQVVDVLARPIDSYGYIGCKSSIHAIQYVGPRDENLPACTITTVLQDVGIQYPHNWCQFRGRIALYSTEGNLLLMNEAGEIDTTWAAPIRRFIRDWTPASTILGHDPKNDVIVLMNTRTILCFSLQNGQWSSPIYLRDIDPFTSVSEVLTSCQTAAGRLYVSILDQSSSLNAYEFDTGTGDVVPVAFVSHYTRGSSGGVAKNVYQFSASFETSVASSPTVVALNRNLQAIALRGVAINSSNNQLFDSAGRFTSQMSGKRFALFYPDIGGVGVDYKIGTLTYSSATTMLMKDLNGVDFIPAPITSELLVFIGDFIEAVTKAVKGPEHIDDLFPNLPDAKSLAFACWTLSNDNDLGSVLDAYTYGTMSETGRVAANA